MAIDEEKRAHTDRMIAETIRNRQKRDEGYREQALKIYPWICGRCAREFARENLQQLTVHHRDHNHDNNPKDGSNWELLCLYCHDNEHAVNLMLMRHVRRVWSMADYRVLGPARSLSPI